MVTSIRRPRALARSRRVLPFALVLCALLLTAPAALANHFYDAKLVSWAPHGAAPASGTTAFKAMQLQDGATVRFVASNQRTVWRFVDSAGHTSTVTRNAFFTAAAKKPRHFLLNGITWKWKTTQGKRYHYAQIVVGSYQNP
jgi:hypothetical protein